MTYCNLDFSLKVILFFGLAMGWQVGSHLVRYQMIKYYAVKQYSFISYSPSFYRVSKFLDHYLSHHMGTSELGVSYHRNSKNPVSGISDVIYYGLCYLMPVVIYLAASKVFCHVFSGYVLVFWVAIQFVVAIYFNQKRFKYYAHNRTIVMYGS